MRTVLILFSAVLLVAFANAQRKSNITKPVVNLEKRPRPPVWHRPPEERRKLSIFPRNNNKFVVTPKPEVNNDDAAKNGLPTKRPLMRKFTMQDRNEKGTWSFAPRKPLMKTNRFTVTMAPLKSNNQKVIDEMKPEESKKVDTVISKVKTELPLSKQHNQNKGNLIEMMQLKNTESLASKISEKLEKEIVEEDISHINKADDEKYFDTVKMNDNITLKLDNVSKSYPIDIRRLNDEDVIVSANETENEYIKLNETAVTLNTKVSDDFLESRAVDLNELKYEIDQHESNSLTMDDEESDNYSIAQVLSFNDLEILLEKIVNNTESSADFNEKNHLNSPKNPLEDIPKFDVRNPSEFYDVISLSHDEGDKTNLENDFLSGNIPHGPQIMTNDERHDVSETNILNGDDFTQNLADTHVVGNLESFIDFMKKETVGIENHHQRGFVVESAEIKTNAKYTLTKNPFTNNPRKEVISNFTSDREYKTKSVFPKELNSNETDSFNSTEILLEMYDSNMSLSSEELPDELVTEIPYEFVTENVNLTTVEILNETFMDSVSVDETSNKSISDTSNSYIEERSNESLIDKSTGGEISNESSSNMAGEELSNETSSFIEDNLNEYTVETSHSGEERSNESSSNMADEELSNESYPDKSNNLTEEISSEYTIETNNSTSEEISNESTSNMAGEEISNESDKSYNLTEEISSESSIEISKSSTGEETYQGSLIDNSDIIIDERISDKSVGSSLGPEISEALTNRFKRSNNIIEEENLPTTVSGFKYTGNEITLNHDLIYKNINA